jgi:hypothetical protein
MIFYSIFGEKRGKKRIWSEVLPVVILSAVTFLSSMLFADDMMIKIIMSILEMAVIMYIFMEVSFMKSLILAFLFEGTLFLVDYFTFLLSRTMFKDIVGIDDMNCIQGGLLILLGKGLLFVVVVMVNRQIGRHSKESMRDDEWLGFIFFPAFTICTIAAMISVLGKPQMQGKDFIYFIIAFGLVGMNIVVFYLINGILKREETIHEDNVFRLQVKNQTQMYYSISDNFEKQTRKTHEYKNQMLCVASLLKAKKYNEAEKYIGNINDKLNVELDSIQTNHVIVDAILNTKYREMIEKNIIFVFRINDLSGLHVSDEDIVVILSNLLNNSIEACEKCKGRRVIRLKFVVEDDGVVLSVKNSYENPLILQNGEYRTTKNEQYEHGIGIHNIIQVIERYNGSYVIKPDDEEFLFSIFIPKSCAI